MEAIHSITFTIFKSRINGYDYKGDRLTDKSEEYIMKIALILVVFILAVLITLWIQNRKTVPFSNMDSIRKPIKIGHRGASGYCPENTMASYQKAIDLGVDFIEIDIHMSKDGKLIVHHDPQLDRTTNGKGLLKDYTSEQLMKMDAGSWFNPDFCHERIPLLTEVLDKFLPQAGILIEIKHPELNPGIEQVLTTVLKNYQSDHKRIMIHSFDVASMKKCHELMPSIPVGVLVKNSPLGISDKFLHEVSEFAAFVNPKHTMMSAKLKQKIHRHGMRAFTWTVNDKKKLKAFEAIKLDGIITDFPDFL